MQVSEAAPVNYSVDMLGSALGVLVYSVIVIPLAGILAGCMILMVVSLLGVILNLKRSVF
jgi:hypothetical protein